eukprot:11157319-Lingulodinium_polyedra.AAC.1
MAFGAGRARSGVSASSSGSLNMSADLCTARGVVHLVQLLGDRVAEVLGVVLVDEVGETGPVELAARL